MGYSRSSGFSLVEFAIVLGVFGIILGGIWGIVTPVREKVKQQQAVDAITQTVSNVRALYQGRPRITGTFATLTDDLIDRGTISNEMIRNRAAPTLVADGPWGTSAANGAALANGSFAVSDNNNGDGLSATDGQSFRVQLRGLGNQSCIAMATRITETSGPAGLLGVIINANLYPVTALPSVAQARTACNTGPNNNTVSYVYRLRQPGS